MIEPSAKAKELSEVFLDSNLGGLDHRINLTQFWGITPGSRVLELGCGQGDCTTVLADAVGLDGHIDAVDPGAPDYGTYISPYTIPVSVIAASKAPIICYLFGLSSFKTYAKSINRCPLHTCSMPEPPPRWSLGSTHKFLQRPPSCLSVFPSFFRQTLRLCRSRSLYLVFRDTCYSLGNHLRVGWSHHPSLSRRMGPLC